MSNEMEVSSLGQVTGPAVGIILKELVRRAITEIRRQRLVFEATTKESYGGTMDDVFTSADTAAQALFVKSIRECFSNVGIVGEEEGLNVEPKNGCTMRITIDPLDGTKAFVRGQSHGVGSMVALMDGEEVISAWVGDVNTQEIYGFRPGSKKTHRISEFNQSRYLGPPTKSLEESYILLRDPLAGFSEIGRDAVELFKNHEIEGGSIGIGFARLWKQEVGGMLLLPGFETPWDSAPVMGISKHLGYAFLRPATGGQWERFNPTPPTKKPVRRSHEMLVVHETMLEQVLG